MQAEEVFRRILIDERKRADRSSQPLALLSVERLGGMADPPVWAAVLDGIRRIVRADDVVGWLESGTALGVILPDLRTSFADRVPDLERQAKIELGRMVAADSGKHFSVQIHQYPGPAFVIGRSGPADLKLFPELQLQNRRRLHEAVKRIVDVVGSVALGMLLTPLLLLIGLLVKLDSPGPVLHGQRRIGRFMKPFTMLKFRTRYVNADAPLHLEYVSCHTSNALLAQEKSGAGTLTDDPRMTCIGRLLRRTNLDELPQLWNVVRGDMSLVGPRPAIPYELEQYKPWHCRRVLEAKPGITGLWQVVGRSRTTFDDMVRIDLRYVRTSSLWTDIKILLATPGAAFSGKHPW
jgi:lipopolysaccharide/colanic/teichoic acid biosynthesis glycosyltransferase